MKIELERRFFTVNEIGSNEFDWLLHMLGIPEDKQASIDMVSFNVEKSSINTEEGL